ncbi:MAG: amidohydrolase [Bacillota bacterium]
MLAITNGKLHTITQGIIDRGTLLIDGGKIVAVGAAVTVPEGAEVIDACGKFVTPGLIDAHSHIGIFGEPSVPATADGNEMTEPVTAQLRGIDSLNPQDPSFPIALAAGVTAVFTGPGSANIIGGTGLAIKLVGLTAEEMAIPGTEAMKMALGENPKLVYGSKNRMPSTRMGNAAVLREALVQAQNYLDKMAQAEAEANESGKPVKRPERNLKWEMLGKVLRREMRARIHAHRADDMLTAIRIAEEFNLDYVIEHATEGYLISRILAEKKVPCVVGPLLMSKAKMELEKVTLENPGLLARAGVKVAIQCDTSSNTRWLPLHAGLAVREGMDEEDAFKAITINAAEIIGTADRMGSLEVGKDADVAIFSGHPFCTYTVCETVLINGSVVYRRDHKPGCCC